MFERLSLSLLRYLAQKMLKLLITGLEPAHLPGTSFRFHPILLLDVQDRQGVQVIDVLG